MVAKVVIDSHIANMDKDAMISSDISIQRFPLILSMTENALFLDRFGTDPILFPMERLEAGAQLPPLFIIHGADDEIVPAVDSKAFVELLLEKKPEAEVHLSIVPGPHGLHETWGMDHAAMEAGLNLVVVAWLGNSAP